MNRDRHSPPNQKPLSVAERLWDKIVHRSKPHHAQLAALCRRLLRRKQGLEIGGPSPDLKSDGVLPLYPFVGGVDVCNFDTRTIWEGDIRDGEAFTAEEGAATGRQWIREATDLDGIADGSYDFVVSWHSLEHTANALAALHEWKRVVLEGGYLLIAVPDPTGTFDHRRPITPFDHFVADDERGIGEDDLTHLPEILELHDLSRDPLAGTPEQFEERSLKNAENRCLHHHVFSLGVLIHLLDHLGLQVVGTEQSPPVHIIALVQKPRAGDTVDNARFVATR